MSRNELRPGFELHVFSVRFRYIGGR